MPALLRRISADQAVERPATLEDVRAAIGASLLPARRASRVDALQALRAE